MQIDRLIARASAVAALSCNGAVLDGGSDVSSAPADEARCAAAAPSDPPPADRDGFATRLVGVWRRCGGPERGIPKFATIAFEKEADVLGNWWAVEGSLPGDPLPGDPPSERGTFDGQPPSTVLFVYDNGARSTVVLLFEDDGRRFRIVQNGFDAANIVYVKDP